MTTIFKNGLHDRLGTWPLAYIPYGGADYGEVLSVAAAVGDGDDDAFHEAWTAAADRLMDEGRAAEKAGHDASARESFLRAACFYGKSFHPLFGEPVDPRVIAASRRQIDAFDRALALGDEPVAPVRIAFETASLLAYVIPAQGRASARRPLLIAVAVAGRQRHERRSMGEPARNALHRPFLACKLVCEQMCERGFTWQPTFRSTLT